MASSRRERELARQRAARQAARRTERERRRRRRNAIVASVVAVVLVAGAAAFATVATTTGDNDPDTLATETPPAAEPAEEPADPLTDPLAEPTGEPEDGVVDPATAGACTYEAGREPSRPVEQPGPEVDRQTPYRAVLDTDQGQIQFQLLTAEAPCTVHSFRHLAAADFFDDTPCHRLTDRGIFVLQCGDPSGTGTGGPGYTFADENLEGATYERGIVAMANSGPNTNGSQFFLVYADSQLPAQYTPFGRLSEESLAVLDRIAEGGAAPPDEAGTTAPNIPVQILDFRVEPAAG
ncbi:MAG TPA: peptidylprolyl isomerase [Mycobacteriales bacterium]|nr:peptidylprolyl isomerase [Mycobacteriales bacterium]